MIVATPPMRTRTVRVRTLRTHMVQLTSLFAVAVALSACANKRGGVIPYEPAGFTRPDLETIAVAPVDQKIGPLDVIAVNVFQVAELSGEHRVDLTGHINMPLIGKVAAQGKSADELGQHIADLLSKKYLRSPNVNVMMRTATQRTITVDGAVGVPGVFPIEGPTTLIKAIAIAKGTADDANPRRVIVFRNINGKRMAAQFDLQQIRRAEASDPEIFGNDIIIVDGNTSQGPYRAFLQALPVVGLLNTFLPF